MSLLELLLADGRFPGGGFAHSGGLEPAVTEQAVQSLPELASFLEGRLHTAGPVEAWLAARACTIGIASMGAIRRLLELEFEAEAHQPSPALRAAGRAQGRGLRRSAGVIWPAVAPLSIEIYPIVLGAVAAAAGCDPAAAARLAVHGIVMTVVSAAPKLFAIDTTDTVALAVRLMKQGDDIAADAAAQVANGAPCPIRSAPTIEARAERHATWEVRLFAS
jgi:urease accessory protein